MSIIRDNTKITDKSKKDYKKLINECIDNDCVECKYYNWCNKNLESREPFFELPVDIMLIIQNKELKEDE